MTDEEIFCMRYFIYLFAMGSFILAWLLSMHRSWKLNKNMYLFFLLFSYAELSLEDGKNLQTHYSSGTGNVLNENLFSSTSVLLGKLASKCFSSNCSGLES